MRKCELPPESVGELIPIPGETLFIGRIRGADSRMMLKGLNAASRRAHRGSEKQPPRCTRHGGELQHCNFKVIQSHWITISCARERAHVTAIQCDCMTLKLQHCNSPLWRVHRGGFFPLPLCAHPGVLLQSSWRHPGFISGFSSVVRVLPSIPARHD